MTLDVSTISALAAAAALVITALGKAAARVIWACRHR
jgi:hypothetical protein